MVTSANWGGFSTQTFIIEKVSTAALPLLLSSSIAYVTYHVTHLTKIFMIFLDCYIGMIKKMEWFFL